MKYVALGLGLVIWRIVLFPVWQLHELGLRTAGLTPQPSGDWRGSALAIWGFTAFAMLMTAGAWAPLVCNVKRPGTLNVGAR